MPTYGFVVNPFRTGEKLTDLILKGIDALLSIGGWTGSIYYSTAVGTANNRTAFVKAIVDMADQYGLDGIDFEWVKLCWDVASTTF